MKKVIINLVLLAMTSCLVHASAVDITSMDSIPVLHEMLLKSSSEKMKFTDLSVVDDALRCQALAEKYISEKATVHTFFNSSMFGRAEMNDCLRSLEKTTATNNVYCQWLFLIPVLQYVCNECSTNEELKLLYKDGFSSMCYNKLKFEGMFSLNAKKNGPFQFFSIADRPAIKNLRSAVSLISNSWNSISMGIPAGYAFELYSSVNPTVNDVFRYIIYAYEEMYIQEHMEDLVRIFNSIDASNADKKINQIVNQLKKLKVSLQQGSPEGAKVFAFCWNKQITSIFTDLCEECCNHYKPMNGISDKTKAVLFGVKNNLSDLEHALWSMYKVGDPIPEAIKAYVQAEKSALLFDLTRS